MALLAELCQWPSFGISVILPTPGSTMLEVQFATSVGQFAHMRLSNE